jgi:hypothetical protein
VEEFNLGLEFINTTVYHYNAAEKDARLSQHSAEVCLQQRVPLQINKSFMVMMLLQPIQSSQICQFIYLNKAQQVTESIISIFF